MKNVLTGPRKKDVVKSIKGVLLKKREKKNIPN